MSAKDNDGRRMPVYRKRWPKRFAKRFKPYGILIAACTLGVALVTLWIQIDLWKNTLTVTKEEKELRKAILEALADEKELHEVSLLSMLSKYFELSRSENYSEHIQIFEGIARTKMDLRNLDASAIDFYSSVREGGIILNNADLRHVNFKGSNLTQAELANTKLNEANLRKATLRKANLSNADLTGAKLRQADMYGADLTGAVLEKAIFREADVSAVNFKDAQGLRQKQLDAACADPREDPPMNLPKDSRTGEQLIWVEKRCAE